MDTHKSGSWDSTREVFEWYEAKLSASLATQVLSKLPKCIHNSIGTQLKQGPFNIFILSIVTATLFQYLKENIPVSQ